ncbi:hypothetical protein [Rhizobium sp. BE258]|uniref:hypothetical protein n=1 Tax=Rhizobium sp. BE258 TaxID=2817722 RepID=UPI002857B97D|nr:hypothetical protein [Rhizobium sp. BE258]MDR7145309.1 hypothetical protein [Rhizobium sp. BE258]
MKSPWKLLGQFISRRDANRESGEEHHALHEDPAGKMVQAPTSPQTLVDLQPTSTNSSIYEDRSAGNAPADSDGTETGKTPLVVIAGEATQPPPVRQPKQKARVPGKRAQKPQANTAETGTPPADTSTMPPVSPPAKRSKLRAGVEPLKAEPALVSEAAELDDQIRQLRRQLAAKLRAQNEHLKAMHARFTRG